MPCGLVRNGLGAALGPTGRARGGAGRRDEAHHPTEGIANPRRQRWSEMNNADSLGLAAVPASRLSTSALPLFRQVPPLLAYDRAASHVAHGGRDASIGGGSSRGSHWSSPARRQARQRPLLRRPRVSVLPMPSSRMPLRGQARKAPFGERGLHSFPPSSYRPSLGPAHQTRAICLNRG